MSDVLSLEDAQAAGIGGELGDDALQQAIDEEEAALARIIGPLVGERTERWPLAGLRPLVSELHLWRPTDEVAMAVGDTDLVDGTDYELRSRGWRIARLPGATRWDDVTTATYTPNDEDEVRRALKQLLTLSLRDTSSGGLQSETIDGYSYALRGGGDTTRARAGVIRRLREPATPGSTRIHSSVPHGLAGALGR